MNIAIIGAGLTGLTAAYELQKKGHTITIFEKEKSAGGLAGGWKEKSWLWPLEIYYHHFFTSDKEIITLIDELGIKEQTIITRPITATYIPSDQNKKEIYHLDSALSLLKFDKLSPIDRIRTGIFIGICKVNPWWKPLEKITTKQFAITIGGQAGWKTIWEPLMIGKFGSYSDQIPASWLWARIQKRTTSLGYLTGGFQTLIDALVHKILASNGTLFTNTTIHSIVENANHSIKINFSNESNAKQIKNFDKVIMTTPSATTTKLIKFPTVFEKNLHSIQHLWAQILILETTEPILKDIYWLNINDRSMPFLALVAHTNFMDKKYYAGHHITYIGNYLPEGHPYLSMTKEQLLNKFMPYIKKINPNFTSHVSHITYHVFSSPSAQPIHTINYSKKAPQFDTPIPNIYIANMDSIYPFDRGTNYAVALGTVIASHLTNNQQRN